MKQFMEKITIVLTMLSLFYSIYLAIFPKGYSEACFYLIIVVLLNQLEEDL